VPPAAQTWQAVPRLSTESHEPTDNRVAFFDGEVPEGLTTSTIVNSGTRVLINPGTQLSPAVERWLRLHPTIPTMLVINATVIRPRSADIGGAARQLARQFDQHVQAVTVVDLRGIAVDQATGFTQQLLGWLAMQPVELISIDRLASSYADRRLGINR
jgi:hypothetical protein